jgi:tetratricopeptide (TPR) repeat protein
VYGRPARAESLFVDLARQYPKISYLSNLSLAQMLQGKYEAAIENLNRALAMNPENSSVLLNLADGEQLSGHGDRAREHYARILDIVARDPNSTSYTNVLIRAQCFAHLGRSREAVAAVQEALRTASDDPDALFQAALVYCVAGERASALVSAQRALEKGLQTRWFALPWFDPLRTDSSFVESLRRAGRSAAL